MDVKFLLKRIWQVGADLQHSGLSTQIDPITVNILFNIPSLLNQPYFFSGGISGHPGDVYVCVSCAFCVYAFHVLTPGPVPHL